MLSYFLLLWLCLLSSAWLGCGPDSSSSASVEQRNTRSSPSVDTAFYFSLNELLGKFDPAVHPDFARIPAPYATRPDLYLRRKAVEALVRMAKAAQAEGINLRVLSATRSFSHQKDIWERKWYERANSMPDLVLRARSILEYSAMPGTSRHHWGTDVDLNSLRHEDFEAGGPHEKVYKWLCQHAHQFGFCQTYTPLGQNRAFGYREEKWHWSYLPLASPMLEQYVAHVTDSLLTGFAGAQTATSLKIIQHYVLGIDVNCRRRE
ncbi:MAG: M15 family metallopeptidase [Saprospiraceae bacterium]|nr:M15 family metallopeptidase [Saprospiraceae bacterium]MDW8483630.1 M15 family metallopeptidase [Saprospiraceae bacterium]